jgi:restriction endonuclease S subunit
VSEDAIAAPGFAVIRGFSVVVMPEYLSVILRSGLCTYQFDQRSTGGNYPAITEEQLLRCEMPIAKKEVQARIASTASSIRAEARKLKADATAALDAAKRGIEMEIVRER